MKKIKIAQIGMNRYSHAPEIFTTMKIHPEVFDLVGYAVVEDERETCTEKINRYFAGYPELSLDQILADPTIEAVAVETDEIHLLRYAQMAADAGKHIHMEKPGPKQPCRLLPPILTPSPAEKGCRHTQKAQPCVLRRHNNEQVFSR